MKIRENYTNIDAKMNQMSETYADSIKMNLNPNEQVFDLRKIINETKVKNLCNKKNVKLAPKT